jgi:hypothetical protein
VETRTAALARGKQAFRIDPGSETVCRMVF